MPYKVVNAKSAIGAILILAAILRYYGIAFHIPHPDDFITVQGAMWYGPAGIHPTGFGIYGLYVWPAFTLVYVNIILYSVYYLLGLLLGTFSGMGSFINAYSADPSVFYLLARIANASWGVGTAWFLYRLGKRMYGTAVGLMAALFLAVSFIHSSNSQFIRPDALTTLFIVVTLTCCIHIQENKDTRYYVFAGVFAGLATATKFTSGVLLASVLVAHLTAEWQQIGYLRASNARKYVIVALVTLAVCLIGGGALVRLGYLDVSGLNVSPDAQMNRMFSNAVEKGLGVISPAIGIGALGLALLAKCSKYAWHLLWCITGNKRLWLVLICFVTSFVLADPMFVLHLKMQVRVFLTDPNFAGSNDAFVGVDSQGFWHSIWWYLAGPLSWGAGRHIAILATLGVFAAAWRRRARDLSIIGFVLVYFIAIAAGKFRWERYVFPMIPFVALYAAVGLQNLSEWLLERRLGAKRTAWALAAMAAFAAALPAYDTLRYDYLLTQEDTRETAGEWVAANVAPGAKIGQDEYTGELSESRYRVTKLFSLSSQPYEYYLQNGYDYLMVSDTQYNRYLAEPAKYQFNVAFYHRLFSDGTLVKEFLPRADLWPPPHERFSKYHIHVSPTIRIYKVERKTAAPMNGDKLHEPR